MKIGCIITSAAEVCVAVSVFNSVNLWETDQKFKLDSSTTSSSSASSSLTCKGIKKKPNKDQNQNK